MDVQTSLEEGGGNEADDVDFSEAEGEEFAETRSESVDTGLESDGDDDISRQAMEAVLLKARKALKQSQKGKKNSPTKKTFKDKDTTGKKTSVSRNPNLAKPVEKEHGGRPNRMEVAKERASKRWTDNDTNILIDMIELRPCLWDVSSKDYKSRDERSKALNEIEDVIGIPPNEIRLKLFPCDLSWEERC